jgi:plastocyanin
VPLSRANASAGAAIVAACLAARPGVAAPGAAGRIEGRVTISVPVPPAPPSAAYGSRRLAATPAPATEISNVIVYVKDAPRQASLPPMRASILQQNETFVPHVVAVTTGSTVEFPNGDPFFHDVFSLSRSGSFDLGSYPKGKSKSERFPRAGLIKVYCHLHSHMSATIMVFDHSYFAIPSADGTFAIDDVPSGTYTVTAWHERIGDSSQQVTVEAGRPAGIQFTLPITAK